MHAMLLYTFRWAEKIYDSYEILYTLKLGSSVNSDTATLVYNGRTYT